MQQQLWRTELQLRYFLDTEFNGFGGELISIALVPEDDSRSHFYEAIACENPTPWVAENVLPVLATNPRRREDVAYRFAQFLIDDEDPVLVADWPEDIAHAARLLVTGPGRMSPVRSLCFLLTDPLIIGPSEAPTVPHNALEDARALRTTLLEFERRMTP